MERQWEQISSFNLVGVDGNWPRDLHEEWESEAEDTDYEEEQIPIEDDEDEILGANSFED